MPMPIAPDGTYYELHGHEDAPSIVLIHGLGLCHELWQPHLEALSKDYRVLNYDLYGHGRSAPSSDEASLRIYAEQLANLMDHLKIEKAAIVGFSIGGMINRRFALDYPNKVSSLVILNSPHDRGKALQAQVEERARMARNQGAMSTMDAALKRWFTDVYLKTGEGVAKVIRWRELCDSESYAQAAWVLANGVRELIKSEAPIEARTLVMACEYDPGSTPAMSVDIATEIEGAKIIVVPEMKHLGLMENPVLFTNSILDFLNPIES